MATATNNNNKMKATELRLGNYVIVENDLRPENGFVHEITEVRQLDCQVELKSMDSTYGQKYKFIKSITLTEEWLTDFGFDKVEMDGDYWFELQVGKLRFTTNDTNFNHFADQWVIGFDFHDNDTEFLNNIIENVHEFQNLYYALTGNEIKEVEKIEEKV